MLHEFVNLRKYVGGVLNVLDIFKNILDVCQLQKSSDILFVLSITRKSRRIDHKSVFASS